MLVTFINPLAKATYKVSFASIAKALTASLSSLITLSYYEFTIFNINNHLIIKYTDTGRHRQIQTQAVETDTKTKTDAERKKKRTMIVSHQFIVIHTFTIESTFQIFNTFFSYTRCSFVDNLSTFH